MEYGDYIDKGFELFDQIENEMCILGKTDDCYTNANYSDGVLTIAADWTKKDIEAKITIERDEVIRKVLAENMEIKEAIGALLKEKICLSARDIER